HLLQHSAGAGPEVAEGVHDDDVVTGSPRSSQCPDERERLERLQVELVEGEPIGVLGGRPALGVDDSDPAAKGGGDGQRRVGLAWPGRTGQGDTRLGLVLGGWREGEVHALSPSRSLVVLGVRRPYTAAARRRMRVAQCRVSWWWAIASPT